MSDAKAKKPTKTAAKKPVKKAAKRVTQEDIEVNFDRIQKTHEEFQKEFYKSLDDSEKTRKEFQKAFYKSLDDSEKARKEAENEIYKALGGLSNTIGKMSESMLIPSLVEKFKKLGFAFEISNRHRKIENAEHKIYTEIHAFLENDTHAIAVEVKTTLRRDEIDWHVERMEKIRRHADLRNDKRQFLGAMAATVVDDDTRRYALKQGFYIIEPSGEDVKIIEPASAKVW
jgi:hypothetical protein